MVMSSEETHWAGGRRPTYIASARARCKSDGATQKTDGGTIWNHEGWFVHRRMQRDHRRPRRLTVIGKSAPTGAAGTVSGENFVGPTPRALPLLQTRTRPAIWLRTKSGGGQLGEYFSCPERHQQHNVRYFPDHRGRREKCQSNDPGQLSRFEQRQARRRDT